MSDSSHSGRFITNQGDRTVGKIMENLAATSKSMDFLVGYFFMSGFCEIQKSLNDQNLRILIGLNADIGSENTLREYEAFSTKQTREAKETIRKEFIQTQIDAYQKSDVLDQKETQASFQTFKTLLQQGHLEIRKTKEQNHAKMYLFHQKEPDPVTNSDSGKIIVGSSNLSYSGLYKRFEINIYLQEDHDYKDGKKIFEDLWKDSIPLVDQKNKDEFLSELIEHTWLELRPRPYLMYLRVLDEFFQINNDPIKTPKEITHDRKNQFLDISYQTDAIREGLFKIRRHSGLIVADVVGLGKSVIASAIAANLDLSTIIITPPHLKSQWEEYVSDFGLRGPRIYTPGKLEQAVTENEGHKNLLVIIDEAHRYRNESTISYFHLHRLCAGQKVLLLTATPFNNCPDDLFSLIKLFQNPNHSTIQTVSDLGAQMEKLTKDYDDLKKQNRDHMIDERAFKTKSSELAEEIRSILDPVVIRRTRIDLESLDRYREDLTSQGIAFTKVEPPRSIEYDLGNLSTLYLDTLDQITVDFHAARYSPLLYLKEDKAIQKKYAEKLGVTDIEVSQRNMAGFAKQLFVRRFESSKFSFLKTLDKMLDSMKDLRNWHETVHQVPLYNQGNLPEAANYQAYLFSDDDEEQCLFQDHELLKSGLSKELKKGMILIDAKDLKPSFIEELKQDIALFEDLHRKWTEVQTDPKLDQTIDLIQTSLAKEPHRKLILFSEFADTAQYLYDRFKEAGLRVQFYSSKDATKSKREKIRQNFDAGYPEENQANDYDLLVATDALSEGISLHRAGSILNYDIPYNPTRVIQRVGRINRINKKVFDQIYIYNFFPTSTGEQISHTQEISTFKMRLFQAILGSDTQILTSEETVEGYLQKQFIDQENEQNKTSWDIPYRNELERIKRDQPDLLKQAKDLPLRVRIARSNEPLKKQKQTDFENALFEGLDLSGVLLFSKKGDSYRFALTDQTSKTVLLEPDKALALFKASPEEKAFPVTDQFYSLYSRAKKESGLVKRTKQNSKDAKEVQTALRDFLKQFNSQPDQDYLKLVKQVLELDALPAYCQKKIKSLGPTHLDSVQEMRLLLPDSYLEQLISKNQKMDSEPEWIILAEELTDLPTQKD